MKHWYWCGITRNGKIETHGENTATVLKAHGMEVDLKSSHPETGSYMVQLPETAEHLELISVQYGVGELTVTME